MLLKKLTIKTMLLTMLVAAIWCKSTPILLDIGKSYCEIYEDWRFNQVIHERMTVINNKFNRPTFPDRLK